MHLLFQTIIITLLLFLSTETLGQPGFRRSQESYGRVRNAFSEKGELVSKRLLEAGLQAGSLNILLVAYKEEGQLEIYARSAENSAYQKLADYRICAGSGEPGPKRRQGDYQVPEGFYNIDRFNPASSFHLSLGINYPNLADRRKTTASNPGGDIFIHGSCVTIGCIPLTDDKIKEVYILAVLAREAGQQKIPVYIFPFKMSDKKMNASRSVYADDPALITFWENLKTGYDLFMQTRRELKIKVDGGGNYAF